MNIVLSRWIICSFILFLGKAIAQEAVDPDTGLAYGLLIPATSTMQRAWEIPRNPLLDSALKKSPDRSLVLYGYKVFTKTPKEVRTFTGNSLSCSNCHLNAGQREKALPLAGVAGVYPEYNKRSGKDVTLEDRII